MPSTQPEDKMVDVTIIGGGWSGLLACKHCLEEGLTVQVLEARDVVGGVWCYSDDKAITTVMKTTRTSSSATVTEMSDFPMPKEIGEFPHHQEILTYLHDYCAKFKLDQHIQLGTKVSKVERVDNTWIVNTNRLQTIQSKYLIVCTGIHQKPNRSVQENIFSSFNGTIHHSSELKEYCSSFDGKNVLIYGGGETASDILENWYPRSKKIIWCIPNGQHFFRKYAKLLPHREPQALDKASSRALKMITPFIKSKPGMAWACKWTTNGSLLAYQGHGIPEWKNKARFFHSFINKQGHVLDYVDYNKVVPKGPIRSVDGKEIVFEDGAKEEIDLVILCTGYTVGFPFLPESVGNAKMNTKYKFVFDVEDPSIAFVGYVRPIVGSIPAVAEVQARWVARVFSGRVPIVSTKARRESVDADEKFWHNHFKDTSRRVATLVEGYTYTDDVAKLSECYPDYWNLFIQNPRGFMTGYCGPFNGASFLLNDGEYTDQALRTIRNHSKSTMSPIFLLMFLFLRLILFDWILDKLGDMKFFIQTSKLWKGVRDHSIVKCMDRIWTLPKRCLFDTEHYEEGVINTKAGTNDESGGKEQGG